MANESQEQKFRMLDFDVDETLFFFERIFIMVIPMNPYLSVLGFLMTNYGVVQSYFDAPNSETTTFDFLYWVERVACVLLTLYCVGAGEFSWYGAVFLFNLSNSCYALQHRLHNNNGPNAVVSAEAEDEFHDIISEVEEVEAQKIDEAPSMAARHLNISQTTSEKTTSYTPWEEALHASEKMIQKLNKENKSLTEQLVNAHIEFLDEFPPDMHQLILQLQKDIQGLEQKIDLATAMSEDLQVKNEKQREMLELAEEKMEEFIYKDTVFRSVMVEMGSRLRVVENENATMAGKLQGSEEMAETQVEKCEYLEVENAKIARKLHENEELCATRLEKCKYFEEENRRLSSQVLRLEEHNKMLRAQLDSFADDITDFFIVTDFD